MTAPGVPGTPQEKTEKLVEKAEKTETKKPGGLGVWSQLIGIPAALLGFKIPIYSRQGQTQPQQPAAGAQAPGPQEISPAAGAAQTQPDAVPPQTQPGGSAALPQPPGTSPAPNAAADPQAPAQQQAANPAQAEYDEAYSTLVSQLRNGDTTGLYKSRDPEASVTKTALNDANLSAIKPDEIAKILEQARTDGLSADETKAKINEAVNSSTVSLDALKTAAGKGNVLAKSIVNHLPADAEGMSIGDILKVQNLQNVIERMSGEEATGKLIQAVKNGKTFNLKIDRPVEIDGETYEDIIEVTAENMDAVQKALRAAKAENKKDLDYYPERSVDDLIQLPDAPQEPDAPPPPAEEPEPEEEPEPAPDYEAVEKAVEGITGQLGPLYRGLGVEQKSGARGLGAGDGDINNALLARNEKAFQKAQSEMERKKETERGLKNAALNTKLQLGINRYLQETEFETPEKRQEAYNGLLQSWTADPSVSPNAPGLSEEEKTDRAMMLQQMGSRLAAAAQDAMMNYDREQRISGAVNNVQAFVEMTASGEGSDGDNWGHAAAQLLSVKNSMPPAQFSKLALETAGSMHAAAAQRKVQ